MSIDTDHDGIASAQPLRLSPVLLWAMRGLAVVGLAVAVFLSYVQLAAMWQSSQTTVPLCGGAAGFDCDAVLFSPQGKWFGLPVGPLAAGVYLLAIACLAAPFKVASRFMLMLLAGLIIAGAAYYLYAHAAVLGMWCSWCLAEHAIGIVLVVLVIVTTPWRAINCRPYHLVAFIAMAFGAVVLGHQGGADGARDVKLDTAADGERWIETIEPGQTRWSIFQGRVQLNPALHPRLGSSDATQFIIEVIDFTCQRCADAQPMLTQTLDALEPTVGAIVVFCPLNPKCNPHVEEASDLAEHACELARLASAVWLVDPGAYPRYHRWLFENGPLDPAVARRFAAALVGESALEDALSTGKTDQMIERDVRLAALLDVKTMPGVIVGDFSFSSIPEQADTLIKLARRFLATAPGR